MRKRHVESMHGGAKDKEEEESGEVGKIVDSDGSDACN